MKNINNNTLRIRVLLGLITITSCYMPAANAYENLESSWYAGGALGMSKLSPDGHEYWDVTDDKDIAMKVYGGINISRDLGLEAFWNNFGDATVTDKAGTKAKVKYSGYGANLVYHVPSYMGDIHPIVKLGMAKLNTKGDGVNVNQKNNFSVMAGVGAEYEFDENFRVRAEYEHYDKDVQQLSLGLNWRPELAAKRVVKSRAPVKKASDRPIVIVNNPAPIAQARPTPRPVIRQAPPRTITNTVVKHIPVYIQQPKQVVKTVFKQAPPPVPAPVVTAPPKTIHKTLAGGSHFATSSAMLTQAGRGALDRLARDLLRDNVVIHNVGIIGHTDSVGDPLSNQRLSEQRARTVANYLSGRGLNRRIMTVLGRGESQPIANNTTAAGRAKNRRVNIVVKGSETLRRQDCFVYKLKKPLKLSGFFVFTLMAWQPHEVWFANE